MQDDFAYALSKRRVTLSTAGVVPGLQRLAEETDISLALSYTISIGFIVILYVFSLYLLRKGHGIRT